MSDVERRLAAAHLLACVGGRHINDMITRRRVSRFMIDISITKLEQATTQLRELLRTLPEDG